MPHGKFAILLRGMDICLQLSYTETFNIVTADAVVNGVPVVTSNEIRWIDPLFHADPKDSHDIVLAMRRAMWCHRILRFWHPNLSGLKSYNRDSVALWRQMIRANSEAA